LIQQRLDSMFRPARFLSALPPLLLAVTLAGCGGGSSTEPEDPSVPFTPLPAARDAMGAVPRGTYVVRSPQALAAVIASNPTGFLPGDPGQFPPVDFGRELVVGVLSGLGNPCLRHEIIAVRRVGATVTVQHRRVEPTPGTGRVCGPGVVPTSVWATMPATDAAIAFEELAVRND
jgi:hypothetical protein